MQRPAVSERKAGVSARGLILGLAAAAGLAMVLTVQPSPHLCNDSSRLAFADAWVNHGPLAIDGTYFESTCDRITRGGKFYSDKPPVLSLLLAGLLWLIQTATGWRIPEDLGALYPTITLLVSGGAFLAAYFGIIRWLSLLGVDSRRAAIAAAAGLSTTLFFVFTSTLNNHTVAGALLVWCLVHATPADEGRDRTRHPMAWLGFLSGLAVVIDPLAAAVAGPLVAVAAWERRRQVASLLPLAAGLLPLGAHVALNLSVGGHPLLVNLDPEAFNFKGSMHDTSTMTGSGWKHETVADLMQYGFHSLFGNRGFFPYSPLAAAGGVGLALWIRGSEDARMRRLGWALFAGICAFAALTIGFSNNYSGWTYGVRWHCLVLPIFAAGIALGDFRLRGAGRMRWRWACGALAVVGAGVAFVGTLQPWTTMKKSGPQSSIEAVLSDSPALVRTEGRAAARMNRTGRHLEALSLAGYAVRRDPRDKTAIAAGMEAAVELEDRDAVVTYWRLARAVEWSNSNYVHLERLAERGLRE